MDGRTLVLGMGGGRGDNTCGLVIYMIGKTLLKIEIISTRDFGFIIYIHIDKCWARVRDGGVVNG